MTGNESDTTEGGKGPDRPQTAGAGPSSVQSSATTGPDKVPTRISYEYLTLKGNRWGPVEKFESEDEARTLLLKEAEEGVADGARVDLIVFYPDYAFTERTILDKRMRRGIKEPAEAQKVSELERHAVCRTAEDFYHDRARAQMPHLLRKFIAERRIVPLELLHSAEQSRALANAGTTVQGALQKVAVRDGRHIGVATQAYLKQLMGLVDQVEMRLRQTAGTPAPDVPPGRYGALLKSVFGRLKGFDAAFEVNRAITAKLAACDTWLEKLGVIDGLIDPRLPRWGLRHLDAFAAEFIAAEGAVMEIGAFSERPEGVDVVRLFVALHSGDCPSSASAFPQRILKAVGAGIFPRTRAAIHKRVLLEIRDGGPLVARGTSIDALDAVRAVTELLDSAAPPLSRDRDIREALDKKVAGALTQERLEPLLAEQGGGIARVKMLLDLAARTPGAHNRDLLLEYLRMALQQDRLTRGMKRDPGASGRLKWMTPLAAIAGLLATTGFSEEVRRDLVGHVDDILTDILRHDVLAQRPTYADRIATLVRITAAIELPPGRCRDLVRREMTQAATNKQLMARCMKAFRDPQQRQKVMVRIKRLIKSAPAGNDQQMAS
ncbi:hypothetical protein [Fodinicurvata sp. EGI_FJ10296]|uniref:hypothetical protein n=1 Tax=Fodinicurvata sp. EGI_FJ10296 TaxID=3231908 RepID=UPI003454154F